MASLRWWAGAAAIAAGVLLIGWRIWPAIGDLVVSYWPVIVGLGLVVAGIVILGAPASAGKPPPPRNGGGDVGEGGNAGSGSAQGPGGQVVGPAGIALTLAYLVGGVVLIMYVLFEIWPRPTPANIPPPAGAVQPDTTDAVAGARGGVPENAVLQSDAPTVHVISCGGKSAVARIVGNDGLLDPSCVSVFGREGFLWAEQRMLLLVLLSGGLGGLLHGLRSIVWYVGNRSFVRSWAATYVMLPFTGAAVAFVFYVVVRGGFFSPQASFAETSAFGFAAMSSLVGLFSGQAILKLKQVAETLLTKAEQGADHVEPQSELPAITLQPDHFVAGQAPAKLTITGGTFTAGHRVKAGSRTLTPVNWTADALIVDVAPIAATARSYDIVVVDAAGKAATGTARLEILPAPQ